MGREETVSRSKDQAIGTVCRENRTPSRFLRFIASAVVVTGASGCLRFVESRPTEKSPEFGGPEEFHALESREGAKLKGLLGGRKKLVKRGQGKSYGIGAGDVLDLKVFDVPELTTQVRVRPDGRFSLPLIGEVVAEGKTEGELVSDLRGRLLKYVNDPQISVFIAQYDSQKVSVTGEVAKPGVYPLRRTGYSLLDLLSEAGGRTQRASTRVTLIPSGTGLAPEGGAGGGQAGAPGRDEGVEVDIEELFGSNGKPLYVPLVPGDTVVVHEAGNVDVDGEVQKPGSYQLSSRTSILGAIAAAGGLTYSAKIDGVEVIRDIGQGRKAALTIDLQKVALEKGQDIRLRDGDVIRVPSQGGRFITRQVVEVLNRILSVGVSGTVR
jgi:polysaccharide export outer membrane protein